MVIFRWLVHSPYIGIYFLQLQLSLGVKILDLFRLSGFRRRGELLEIVNGCWVIGA